MESARNSKVVIFQYALIDSSESLRCCPLQNFRFRSLGIDLQQFNSLIGRASTDDFIESHRFNLERFPNRLPIGKCGCRYATCPVLMEQKRLSSAPYSLIV